MAASVCVHSAPGPQDTVELQNPVPSHVSRWAAFLGPMLLILSGCGGSSDAGLLPAAAAVLRIGANAVDRSSWEGAQRDLTPVLPAQIDGLAAFVRATQSRRA